MVRRLRRSTRSGPIWIVRTPRIDREEKAVQLWITIRTRCDLERGKISVECESVADGEVSKIYRDWLTFKDK